MTTPPASLSAPADATAGSVGACGERALIERIIRRLAMPPWVVVGPGDDAAVVTPERGALVVLTTDAQIEGVHFDRRYVPPEAVGHRALAINLSDLAAMGAKPRGALLSLALPETLDVAFVDRLLDGLIALADAHDVAVVGGNIARSPGPIMVDVTAFGSVHSRRRLARSGARPGDRVFVTGTVGSAAAGLDALQRSRQRDLPAAAERFLMPAPRVRAGLLLGRNRAASACMDLSDGLADAVRQVAEASHVGIALDAASLPVADEVRQWHLSQGRDPGEAVLKGGEDYELLFTVRPAHLGRLRHVRRHLQGLPVTEIGSVTRERTLVVRSAGAGMPLPRGFEHFQ
jgi:thiamine-monophosphate kinase